jgi:hypothetical protein
MGISLDLDNFQDHDPDLDPFELVEEEGVGPSTIPNAVRNAIIADKAEGVSTKELAIRYDCSESTIRSIWRSFVQTSARVRSIAHETQQDTRNRLKGKAVIAIESGLDCERDPYRRGALGVQVMKGIGEFKEDNSGARVAVLVGNLPVGWKERYITTGDTPLLGDGSDDDNKR